MNILVCPLEASWISFKNTINILFFSLAKIDPIFDSADNQDQSKEWDKCSDIGEVIHFMPVVRHSMEVELVFQVQTILLWNSTHVVGRSRDNCYHFCPCKSSKFLLLKYVFLTFVGNALWEQKKQKYLA